MSESSPDESDAARMMLEPDAVHEEEDGGPSLDCPSCGATITLVSIIEEGRCTGRLDGDMAEAESGDEQLQEGGCGAELSLELVWDA